MLLQSQLFQNFDGLSGSRPVPALRRFRSNLVWGNQFLTPELIAEGSDGDALLHGIKISLAFV